MNKIIDIAAIIGTIFLVFGLVIAVLFIGINLLKLIFAELTEYFINQLI